MCEGGGNCRLSALPRVVDIPGAKHLIITIIIVVINHHCNHHHHHRHHPQYRSHPHPHHHYHLVIAVQQGLGWDRGARIHSGGHILWCSQCLALCLRRSARIGYCCLNEGTVLEVRFWEDISYPWDCLVTGAIQTHEQSHLIWISGN